MPGSSCRFGGENGGAHAFATSTLPAVPSPRSPTVQLFHGMAFRKKHTYHHHAGLVRGEVGTKAVETLFAITGKLRQSARRPIDFCNTLGPTVKIHSAWNLPCQSQTYFFH